jgi:hypothetical protein
MDQKVARNLSEFNRLVLACQDEAYTLACYFLTSDAQAEAAMEEAIQIAFRCFSSDQVDCRLLILKLVVEQCRRQNPTPWSAAKSEVWHNLRFVSEQERMVLVLIDVLGLSYSEVADVMGQSVKEIGWLLCQARRQFVKVKGNF